MGGSECSVTLENIVSAHYPIHFACGYCSNKKKMSVMSQLDTSFAHLFHIYLFFQHLIYCLMFIFLLFGTQWRTTKIHPCLLLFKSSWNFHSQIWLQNQVQALSPSRLTFYLCAYNTFSDCIFPSYL